MESELLNKSIKFLDTPMHVLTMNETVDIIKRRIFSKQFTQHVVVNVAKIVNMRSDVELNRSVTECDIVNIDGMGVVWGAKFLGFDVKERVAGVDLFYELNAMAEQEKFSVFYLGAQQEVVEKTSTIMQHKHPNLLIAGHNHGYFWDDEQALVEKIKASGAKLLFVAITSPKKENFINKWRDELGVDFVMGVGGTFDVVAGKVNRAPKWMQNAGLEWLYRVIQEPRRMWKRYLITNSKFAWLLLKAKMK
ncbi:WecB/TagA/CpsF family glycosyltransferase [Vibrio aestuarianus]|uniref:WecB/TagA/CpsF family glycosyltransferase n=1 Tax=Vibrio aestuarianus TaxID=28171 RepID=A0A7X6N957_9VIBR|nr:MULTISPECIES: WecB/TagA/CpsF family glycosyltransferase [Vibrio]KOE82953.1 UDP-N-acetyl-D-mannosamine transferase [Vibrio alginolyticus]MDE1219905.1 WecB/TagA/CpsF family glycosyltransferase [Vibrio aestuarianus]MDE1225614.1 WecB/TagA/CpsF family glycosyltransferase [Vibrio aestuarianus]MDE1237978.1 WecB/TagA/CpsF family glycosyltransferase [Vibrio aestuarianus]MDE1250198.1 WecB/TagA/CpsF family glycosyltransferase [Vibrio aestuarianus]